MGHPAPCLDDGGCSHRVAGDVQKAVSYPTWPCSPGLKVCMWAVSLHRLVWPPLPGTSLCPSHPLAVLLGNLVPIRALFDVCLAREFMVLVWAVILVLPLPHCEPLGRWFNLTKPKSLQPHNVSVLGLCAAVRLWSPGQYWTQKFFLKAW